MARIPKEVLQHFANIPLFWGVSKEGLEAIAMAADEFDEPAGKVLVREGEHQRDLYVIVTGTVEVSRDGRPVATMGPGDFFGELALIGRGPRMATVTATSDVSLMVLAPQRFEDILEREPGIARALLSTMADRLRNIDQSFQH